MLWRFFRKADLLTAGELARRVHSQWLTAALRSRKPYPRIPVRPVAAGGFSELLEHPHGRRIAEAWWDSALEQVEATGSTDGQDESTS